MRAKTRKIKFLRGKRSVEETKETELILKKSIIDFQKIQSQTSIIVSKDERSKKKYFQWGWFKFGKKCEIRALVFQRENINNLKKLESIKKEKR